MVKELFSTHNILKVSQGEANSGLNYTQVTSVNIETMQMRAEFGFISL